MVNFRRLTDQAKKLVDKRGGTDALKEDAERAQGIATSKGSLKDKAKARRRGGRRIRVRPAKAEEKPPE